MSGMAGNVTAFNTVWTYDIYQAYIRPRRRDAHYLWMGRMATVVRHRASAWPRPMSPRSSTTSWTCCSWCSRSSTRRCSRRSCSACSGSARPGTARLPGCWAGRRGGAAPWADAAGGRASPASKAAGSARLQTYPSEMAQNFWTAIFAWTILFCGDDSCSRWPRHARNPTRNSPAWSIRLLHAFGRRNGLV